jgi:SNF family Na+-dependent transporter
MSGFLLLLGIAAMFVENEIGRVAQKSNLKN